MYHIGRGNKATPTTKRENTMTTKINSIMLNLASFREDMQDLPLETVKIHIAAYRGLISMLKLKRDQHAASSMLDAMIHKMIQSDLTMAYQYMGELFAVYSKPVPGMESTEVLHGLNLKQDAWDNMPRVMVWANSGKIYG